MVKLAGKIVKREKCDFHNNKINKMSLGTRRPCTNFIVYIHGRRVPNF